MRRASVAARHAPVRRAPSHTANTVFVLLALIGKQHVGLVSGLPGRSRRLRCGGSSPRALQQQRTLLIYIEEPAVQGGGLQVDADRRRRATVARASQAARTGAKPSSRQRRSQASEISDELLERVPPATTAATPCSAIEVAGNSVPRGEEARLMPTPSDDKLRICPSPSLRLEQDAGDLAAVYQHVVRPFVATAPSRWQISAERVADGQRRDKAELRCPTAGQPGRKISEA